MKKANILLIILSALILWIIGQPMEAYAKALEMVEQEHFEDADYFQTFVYQYPDGKEVRFWIILDERENASNILTALLPEDY